MDKPPPPPLQAVGARPITAYCPHCRVELQIQPQHAGEAVSCPNCGGRFQTPMPQAATAFSSARGSSYGPDTQLNPGIKICVLVSGVTNIAVGICWIATLCGAPIGIAQIVLAIFEIMYFAQVDQKPLHEALSRAQLLGILEIVSGVFNLISLPCGILVLVFASNQK